MKLLVSFGLCSILFFALINGMNFYNDDVNLFEEYELEYSVNLPSSSSSGAEQSLELEKSSTGIESSSSSAGIETSSSSGIDTSSSTAVTSSIENFESACQNNGTWLQDIGACQCIDKYYGNNCNKTANYIRVSQTFSSALNKQQYIQNVAQILNITLDHIRLSSSTISPSQVEFYILAYDQDNFTVQEKYNQLISSVNQLNSLISTSCFSEISEYCPAESSAIILKPLTPAILLFVSIYTQIF